MRAVAVFPGRKEIRIVNHAEPQITKPTQVKLRILEVGVCGTDKEISTFTFGSPPEGDDYLIIGHEALGEVIEVGPEVHTLQPGDLAVPIVRHPCAHDDCRTCQAGRQDFCYSGDYTERGIKHEHGFLTEFVVEEARYVHYVPPHLRDVGVLVEPLTIAEKAFSQVWQIQQRLPWSLPNVPTEQPGRGLNAVVLGAGPIGLLGAMALLIAGFNTSIYSRSPAPNPKATLAEAIGAAYISSKTTSVTQLAAQIGNIDLVYEAAGAPSVAFEAMNVLARNGIFVFTSFPSHPTSESTASHAITLKNQAILGTVNAGPQDFTSAIRNLDIFLARWPEATRGLITGRYTVKHCNNVLVGKIGGIKNVIVL